MKGICESCERRRVLKKSHYYSVRFYPNRLFRWIIDKLPYRARWWIETKPIPAYLCEECYIANTEGIYPLECRQCNSVVFVRWSDFSMFNLKQQELPKNCMSFELLEAGMTCPYCQHPLVDLVWRKRAKGRRGRVQAVVV